jgi:hypothetical protein
MHSLKGWEIKNIGTGGFIPSGSAGSRITPMEYSNSYHQPRENQNIIRSYRPSDPLVNPDANSVVIEDQVANSLNHL